MTAFELERESGKFSHKSLLWKGYNNYLRSKLRLNQVLGPLYREPIYRKLRLNTHILRQKWETKVLHRFREVIGAPDEIIIGN